MRFWDASAIVPLLIEEAGSELVQAWFLEDRAIALWALTRLELVSSIERRVRESALTSAQRLAALEQIQNIAKSSHEVSDVVALRARSIPLLGRYPLRAADAAQLGAALLVAEANVEGMTFVTLDRRLAEAARREGFHVLSWKDEP